MSLEGQRLQLDRYHLVPRTLSLLIRGDELLLLQLRDTKAAWSGKLNGIGGHVERGENPYDSAKREILEETGIRVERLSLVGVVAVDVSEAAGVGLYVYAGRSPTSELRGSPEGRPIWVPLADLTELELVEDLPTLIPRALSVLAGNQPPFSGLSTYDGEGNLAIKLLP